MKDDESTRSKVLRIIAFFCFLTALALIVLLRLFETERFMRWYSRYADTLISYENWVQNLGNSALVISIILLNYVLKAVIPWLPLTIMMFVSGMIYDWYIAIPLILVGCIILFSIKFMWGRKWGGGNAKKILRRFDRANLFVDSGKLGSKMTLFIARLTPLIPVNSVSQLYGTTDLNIGSYLIISIVGFSYKLVSYTMIGRNIFNPLSLSFILPLIGLLIATGLVLLLINVIITATSPLFKRLTEKKGSKTDE